jgi:hypothetical protein
MSSQDIQVLQTITGTDTVMANPVLMDQDHELDKVLKIVEHNSKRKSALKTFPLSNRVFS